MNKPTFTIDVIDSLVPQDQVNEIDGSLFFQQPTNNEMIPKDIVMILDCFPDLLELYDFLYNLHDITKISLIWDDGHIPLLEKTAFIDMFKDCFESFKFMGRIHLCSAMYKAKSILDCRDHYSPATIMLFGDENTFKLDKDPNNFLPYISDYEVITVMHYMTLTNSTHFNLEAIAEYYKGVHFSMMPYQLRLNLKKLADYINTSSVCQIEIILEAYDGTRIVKLGSAKKLKHRENRKAKKSTIFVDQRELNVCFKLSTRPVENQHFGRYYLAVKMVYLDLITGQRRCFDEDISYDGPNTNFLGELSVSTLLSLHNF
jgi:hypothetical protein